MPYTHTKDGIRYYHFKILEGPGLQQAVFTRRGGVSPEPWKGLNVGGTVGDDAQRVSENCRRALCALGRAPESVYDVWQVHGRVVVSTDRPRREHEPHLKADGILTNRPQVTLFMRFADCVPVLLFDPVKRVIGVVHSGWQGTVQRAAAAAVEAMQARYGSRPGDLLAGIGPSIGPDHYEVGPDVVREVHQAFPSHAESLLVPHNGRFRFDLWQANRLVLNECGVHQVEVAEVCTACNLEDWYSHRAEGGKTGRFGALLALG